MKETDYTRMQQRDPASLQPERVSAPVDPSAYESAARLVMVDPSSGMAFTALTPSLHKFTVDVGPGSGGNALGPEPKELLLVALGTCTGMDVISILRKKRQRVTHYSVNVYANEARDHPRVYTDILVEHIVGGENLDPAAVARSIELSVSRFCPVNAMLSRSVHIVHVYRLLESQVRQPAVQGDRQQDEE